MVSDRLRMSLLPALQALLENVSVTRAAETMHVTQSTMSRTLGQLRGVLHDPILVREGNHIFLSEKARKLQPLVDRLVADADSLFESEQFNPLTSRHHFRITAASHFQEVFLSRALSDIRLKAPSISFSISANNNETLQALENGELDLGFLQLDTNLPNWLQGEPVVKDHVRVVLRRDHPLACNGISSLSDLDDYPYVGMKSPMHETPFADILKSGTKSLQQPWMMIDNYAAARQVLKLSDGFTLSNPFVSDTLFLDQSLATIPLPVELPENMFWMVWPEHWAFSQAHQWFRKQMLQYLKQFYLAEGREEDVIG